MKIEIVSNHLSRTLMLVSTITLAAGLAVNAIPHQQEDSEDEAIKYRTTAPNDVIAKIQKDLDTGVLRLPGAGRQGILAALLKRLNIPIDSQILVFSKTSFQRDLISPTNPRALYFNDSTYIGWVQGSSIIEVLTMDPNLGAVFYTLDQDAAKLKFKRGTDECLQCHETSMSNRIPGNIFRSVFPHADGQPEFSAGSYLTDDSSPMEERWGGWYVTGQHGTIRHMGNAMVSGSKDNVTLDRNAGANVSNLSRYFTVGRYLSPTSDIVALMVAEHQTHIQNLITRAAYQTRIAERYDEALNKDLNRPKDYHSDSMRSRIASVCEPLVRAMLFAEEQPLAAPITPSNGFAAKFQAEGPADSKGRSLRQLDLKNHLMRYRCSYLVYSDQFKGLPDRARQFVYKRLNEVLTGKDDSKPYAAIPADEKAAIHQILLETCAEYQTATKATPSVTTL